MFLSLNNVVLPYSPEDIDRMVNSVDPDQTAPSEVYTALQNCPVLFGAKAILMKTHNECFYGEPNKSIR